MPSPDSILLVTAPEDGSYADQFDDIKAVLNGATATKSPAGHKTYTSVGTGNRLGAAQAVKFPEFKVRSCCSFLGYFIFWRGDFRFNSARHRRLHASEGSDPVIADFLHHAGVMAAR